MAPTFADVNYGAFDRNVLDFWQADVEQPAPLLVYVHGGGFASGAFNGSTAFADAMHKSSKLAGAGRGDRIMEPAAYHYAATGGVGVGRPLGAGRGAAKMRNAYAY